MVQSRSSEVHVSKRKEVSLLKTHSTKRKKTSWLGLKKKRIITWKECLKSLHNWRSPTRLSWRTQARWKILVHLIWNQLMWQQNWEFPLQQNQRISPLEENTRNLSLQQDRTSRSSLSILLPLNLMKHVAQDQQSNWGGVSTCCYFSLRGRMNQEPLNSLENMFLSQ